MGRGLVFAITCLVISVTLLNGFALQEARAAGVSDTLATTTQLPDYFSDKVEPVLANRCTVCHGCTEAPCQLKFTSYMGLKRGLSQEVVLSFRGEITASRMKDATDVPGWRARKFSPVVADDPSSGAEQNKVASILYHAITAGQKNKAGEFDADAVRPYFEKDEYYCPNTTSEYKSFIKERPQMGMPLGLPALNQDEYKTLVNWIAAGAPGPSASRQAARLSVKRPDIVAKWESFFNQPGSKNTLIARYVYEHVATLRFHFEENPGEYFELVRSSTFAPEPIKEIVTETAPADPGTLSFAYRFQKVDEILVKKSHIVWNVNLGEIDRLTALFNSVPWNVPALFNQTHSGNPFRDFKAIPAVIRSRFMMTHSLQMIDQMVRGTVCLGSAATFAIRDHFWVMFLKPEADPSVQNPTLGMFSLYFHKGFHSIPEIPTSLDRNSDYRQAFETELRKIRPAGLSLDDVWNGEGGDPNARITVLRHENIASVHHGWIGGRPPTAWILSYSNFERLFYNLVANYKYWGKLTHRFGTWEMMRNIRVEGEELFVSLLPDRLRWNVHTQWTVGYGTLNPGEPLSEGRPTLVSITNDKDPVGDLLMQLAPRFASAVSEIDDKLNLPLARSFKALPAPRTKITSFAEFEAGLRTLTFRRDRMYPRLLPSVSYARVLNPATGEYRVYSLVANRAYSSHESPLGQQVSRVKEQDNLSVFPGIIGTHANLFFDLELPKAGAFLKELFELRPNQLRTFKAKYGVSRSSPAFWRFSDWLTQWHMTTDPVNGARIDLSQYDNGLGEI